MRIYCRGCGSYLGRVPGEPRVEEAQDDGSSPIMLRCNLPSCGKIHRIQYGPDDTPLEKAQEAA